MSWRVELGFFLTNYPFPFHPGQFYDEVFPSSLFHVTVASTVTAIDISGVLDMRHKNYFSFFFTHTPIGTELMTKTFPSSYIMVHLLHDKHICKMPKRNQVHRSKFLLAGFQHLPDHPHQCPVLQSGRHSLFISELFIHFVRCAMSALLDAHIHTEPGR